MAPQIVWEWGEVHGLERERVVSPTKLKLLAMGTHVGQGLICLWAQSKFENVTEGGELQGHLLTCLAELGTKGRRDQR